MYGDRAKPEVGTQAVTCQVDMCRVAGPDDTHPGGPQQDTKFTLPLAETMGTPREQKFRGDSSL